MNETTESNLFTKYGCNSELSKELETLITSIDCLQRRYNTIQTLCYFFSVNSKHLNTFTATQLLNLPHSALVENSDIFQKELAKKEELVKFADLSAKPVEHSDAFRCAKCDQILESKARQTRSADEGMTFRVFCSNCSKLKKM